MAYLIDNLKKSASDGRTPPIGGMTFERPRNKSRIRWLVRQSMTAVPSSSPTTGGRQVFEQVRNDLVAAYMAAGLDDATALREASREAQRRLATPKHGSSDSVPSAKDILAKLPLKLL